MPAILEPKRNVRKKAVRRRPKKAIKKQPVKDVSEETNVVFGEVVELSISEIKRNPHNRHPKQADVESLAESISLHDQLEPCLVRSDPFGGYEMISGETRLLAHKHLNRKTVQCRVGRCDDATALKLVAAANGARKDLDPIQRAELLQRLCLPVEDGGSGLTQEEAGKLVAEDGKPMSQAGGDRLTKLLANFYSIFTKDELSELIDQLKIKSVAIVEAKTKGEMVDALSVAFVKTPPILKGK